MKTHPLYISFRFSTHIIHLVCSVTDTCFTCSMVAYICWFALQHVSINIKMYCSNASICLKRSSSLQPHLHLYIFSLYRSLSHVQGKVDFTLALWEKGWKMSQWATDMRRRLTREEHPAADYMISWSCLGCQMTSTLVFANQALTWFSCFATLKESLTQ